MLRSAFADVTHVLEIGSGSGQDAVWFGQHLPHLTWQPTEVAAFLPELRAGLELEAPDNVLTALSLDVAEHPWPVKGVDGVFSANTLHIISWDHVGHLFRGVGEVLVAGGTLCVYGPFRYGGKFTTPSNAEFDTWLKRRDPGSGVRDSRPWTNSPGAGVRARCRSPHAGEQPVAGLAQEPGRLSDVLPARGVLRHRDFAFFLGARFLSTAAIQVQNVAVGWLVYDITRDPLALGLVGLVPFLPAVLLALVAGHVADRYDRRRILIACYTATLLTATGLLVFAHEAHHRGQLTVLMRQAGLPVPGVYGPSREEWAGMGLPPQE